ncbi:hypothetical protein [Evtepia gabavorous]|uniref:hypothetical protein n=1 Tax=Evtepia gabavorous TaxID=2211183 RepID=UPI00399612FB
MSSRRWDDALDFQTAMASARVARAPPPPRRWTPMERRSWIKTASTAPSAPPGGAPALAAEMEAAATGPDHWVYTRWESGLPGYPDPRAGYFLYI